MTAALVTIDTTAPVRHDVTILGSAIRCTCDTFKLSAAAWGPSAARRLAFAHLARPDLSVAALVEFVVGEGS